MLGVNYFKCFIIIYIFILNGHLVRLKLIYLKITLIFQKSEHGCYIRYMLVIRCVCSFGISQMISFIWYTQEIIFLLKSSLYKTFDNIVHLHNENVIYIFTFKVLNFLHIFIFSKLMWCHIKIIVFFWCKCSKQYYKRLIIFFSYYIGIYFYLFDNSLELNRLVLKHKILWETFLLILFWIMCIIEKRTFLLKTSNIIFFFRI